jgi:hypothetical protein
MVSNSNKRFTDPAAIGSHRAPVVVPFEHYDDVTDEMIEKAKREACAPAKDDRNWKVVESIW